MASLIDLLSVRYAPIQDNILFHLGPAEIARLTCTCRASGCLWPTLMAHDYNINHRMRYHFKDPRKFRTVQGECDALIMDGISPEYMNFLQRSHYSIDDIYLMIETSRMRPMIAFLEREGYKKRQYTPSRDDHTLIYSSTTFGYSTVNTNHENSSSMDQAMRRAWSTAGLTFISWNKAYTLFAYDTFVKERSHLISDSDDLLHSYLGKVKKMQTYKWYLFGTWNKWPVAEEGPDMMVRRVGDRHTWILDLDIKGVTAPSTPVTVLESTIFELRRLPDPYGFTYYDSEPKEYPRYQLKYGELRHPILKHRYLVPALSNEPGNKCITLHRKIDLLADRMERLTLAELEKISEAERPPGYYQLRDEEIWGNDLRDTFVLPATWTFYDDEVLGGLKDAWEKRDDVWVEEESSDGDAAETSTEIALV
jgi:hypothetical protein